MNDDSALAAVSAAFDVLDPVPPGVLAAGRGALRHRLPGARLAEPLTDDVGAPAGTRGTATRRLTFTVPDATVTVEICDGELTGRITPQAAAVPVTVRGAHGVRDRGVTDVAGRFAFTDLRTGAVSLVLDHPTGTVTTSWILL